MSNTSTQKTSARKTSAQKTSAQKTSAQKTSAQKTSAQKVSGGNRTILVALLAASAFFGAYRFAAASSAQASGTGALAALDSGGILGNADGAAAGGASAGGASGGGGCCGSGGGAPIEGAATVEGGVQKISIDLSSGSYNPNVLKLKAGVPAEITFGQSSGCTASVQSSDLGFNEDLSSGPKTVKVKGLTAGTYNFACGMDMVTGQIVVE